MDNIINEVTDKVRAYDKRIISIVVAIIMGILLSVLVVQGLEQRQRNYLLETQESLAQEVLRFHVLANSNSTEDQALKLHVRDQVIAYMEEELEEHSDLQQTKVWAENHQIQIRDICKKTMEESGYDYDVNVKLVDSYFPVKTYGDLTFPEGEYEALKIEIGEAAGENWWCCLYPSLCFIDETISVVSEEGEEVLEEALTEDEYKLITSTTERKISWFFF